MGTIPLPGKRHLSGIPWMESALWCRRPLVRIQGEPPVFDPSLLRRSRNEKGVGELGLKISRLLNEGSDVVGQVKNLDLFIISQVSSIGTALAFGALGCGYQSRQVQSSREN